MSSFLHTVGLRAASSASSIPNRAPYFVMFHFFFAYGVLSSRTLKQIYGIDHNASPREDLTKYGDAAVKEGKITPAQLAMLKRNEGAHANSVENFTLLCVATTFASIARVPSKTINTAALTYTVARIFYAVVYIRESDDRWSQMRGVCWWLGNVSCLVLLWKAGKILGGIV